MIKYKIKIGGDKLIKLKSTASGKNIHLTDSADSKVIEFGLHGKAEQKQYSGKNELENTATTQTIDGVSFTVNDDDKSVTVNGTATENIYFTLNPSHEYTEGSYVLSGCPTGGSRNTYYLSSQPTNTWVFDVGSGATFNVLESKTFRVEITIMKGTTVNNLVFKPMIRKASITDSTYEPYVGGTASPNPDYPQDIEVAGESGSIEVESVGKNLDNAEYVNAYIEMSGKYLYPNDKTKTSVVKCKPNTTYTASRNTGATLISMAWYKKKPSTDDKTALYEKYVRTETESALSITTGEGAEYLAVTWNRSADTSPIEWTQIEEGAIATPYQPYTETKSLISTPEGLASVGGVYDEIIKYADGSGKRIQRIVNAVNSGISLAKHTLSNDSFFVAYIVGSGASLLRNCKCTHLRVVDTGEQLKSNASVLCLNNTNPVHISVPVSIANDVNTLKTWLLDNDVKIYYALAEPIITDLTAEEIAEIEKLHTFYPVTNISNDADCNMVITYELYSKWITPKTDWTSSDAFDYTQYNRVTGNITFLKAFADGLFAKLTDLSLETEKDNLSAIYARHMNAIEDGLDKLNIETYGFDIGKKKTYKPNGNVPTYEEYNRIESACLLLYRELQIHKENLFKISFTLGNQKGIRV